MLQQRVHGKLTEAGRLVSLSRGGGVSEESSLTQPFLQVSDIAAGYAKDLYRHGGAQLLSEQFRLVVINGAVVRDWAQIDQPHPSSLMLPRG